MGQALWWAMPSKGMVAEPHLGLRLTVVPTEAPLAVRFVLEDRARSDGVSLPILSGYRENVTAAMRAAEEAADRIGEV